MSHLMRSVASCYCESRHSISIKCLLLQFSVSRTVCMNDCEVVSKMSRLLIGVIVILVYQTGLYAEKPCAAREVPNRSVVCVCNETYCDDIVRDIPLPGSFVAYTSSEAGSRFNKTQKRLTYINNKINHILKLDFSTLYQEIEGFGGAITDAAAINWWNMSQPLRGQLIRTYYSDTGLEYNMMRVPIGGSDFSTHPYAYNEYPINDTHLSNFTLTKEDLVYKIPMIHEAFSVATAPIKIVTTTWSPPPWMKTNNDYVGFSQLREQYYQTYALYHYKFLEQYAAHDVPVWAITTTNEPMNGIIYPYIVNCLGWYPSNMGKWISQNLGPTIRNSTFRNVKILALDDQRYDIPIMINVMLREHPSARQYIDGVAVHFYGDMYTPAAVLTEVTNNYPEMFILGTEACEGSFPWERLKVDIGSWKRAVSYIKDILTDLNHNFVGWMDWNICLNAQGGPTWTSNFVDSPIIVSPEKKEFIKQPMFYAMGHFSKFLPPGSRRVKTVEEKGFFKSSVENVAFITPRKTVVAVLFNGENNAEEIAVQSSNRQASLTLEPNSITTVEISI